MTMAVDTENPFPTAINNLSFPLTISSLTSTKSFQNFTSNIANSTQQYATTTGADLNMINVTSSVTNVMSSLQNQTTETTNDVTQNELSWDDATWILTSSFIIFTMQSGFGLLEAGAVHAKNEVNIMVKNAIDVVFGGITYWMFGYGLSFGTDAGSNPFCGVGHWFVESSDPAVMGQVYSTFIFQLSFATTATTIVSGAMAERTNLKAYIIFSFVNTIVYCIPAHWVWGANGFLAQLGCIDIGGSGAVHTLGAASAFVAASMLGPRTGRYDKGTDALPLGNATNTLVGMFMLWWGWLAFNCGSTFGISNGKWILASRTACTTLNASMGGGIVGILYSGLRNKGKFLVPDLANSILGGLVGITACCALVRPWESVIIGAVGGFVACAGAPLLDKIKVDDPVGAVAVHGFGGIWGMLAVGLFVDVDPIEKLGGDIRGLFHGGGFYSLGIQTFAIVCICAWSGTITFIMLFLIDKAVGIRMSVEDEEIGSDLLEHDIGENYVEQANRFKTVTELLAMHAMEQKRGTVFGFRRPSIDVDSAMRRRNTGTLKEVNEMKETGNQEETTNKSNGTANLKGTTA